MVRERDFEEIRRELLSLRESYDDLEQLIENADDLGVNIDESERVKERHQEFIDNLLTHYMRLEELLTRADYLQDSAGRVSRELPADVPAFVTERSAGRESMPELPEKARNVSVGRGPPEEPEVEDVAEDAEDMPHEPEVDLGEAEPETEPGGEPVPEEDAEPTPEPTGEPTTEAEPEPEPNTDEEV